MHWLYELPFFARLWQRCVFSRHSPQSQCANKSLTRLKLGHFIRTTVFLKLECFYLVWLAKFNPQLTSKASLISLFLSVSIVRASPFTFCFDKLHFQKRWIWNKLGSFWFHVCWICALESPSVHLQTFLIGRSWINQKWWNWVGHENTSNPPQNLESSPCTIINLANHQLKALHFEKQTHTKVEWK